MLKALIAYSYRRQLFHHQDDRPVLSLNILPKSIDEAFVDDRGYIGFLRWSQFVNFFNQVTDGLGGQNILNF